MKTIAVENIMARMPVKVNNKRVRCECGNDKLWITTGEYAFVICPDCEKVVSHVPRGEVEYQTYSYKEKKNIWKGLNNG